MKEEIRNRIRELNLDQARNLAKDYRAYKANEYRIEALERLLDLFED